jgi:hypothetical protein
MNSFLVATTLTFLALSLTAHGQIELRPTQTLKNKIETKISSEPQLSFQELVHFASSLNDGWPVNVRLDPKKFFVVGQKTTACGHVEAEVPVRFSAKGGYAIQINENFVDVSNTDSGIQLMQILWNNQSTPRLGKHEPWLVDPVSKRAVLIFTTKFKKEEGKKMKWWQEIVATNPDLELADPFLLVSWENNTFKFSNQLSEFQHRVRREVRATKEELKSMPFSRIYVYEGISERVQVPESCKELY